MSSLTCSQVWLNPLADDCQPTNVTKICFRAKISHFGDQKKSNTKYIIKGILPKKNRTKLTVF